MVDKWEGCNVIDIPGRFLGMCEYNKEVYVTSTEGLFKVDTENNKS